MNEDIRIMMGIYDTYNHDWLGDEFKDPSELTRHHIIKKEHNGDNCMSNYALLTRSSHMFLHFLEENYYKEYLYLNSKLLELNRSLKPPTIKYYEDIHRVIKSVKKRMKNKSRGMKR